MGAFLGVKMIKAKEKRDEVLYCSVTKTNKKWLKKEYKKLGFSTLSEYVNTLLDNIRLKKK